MPAAEEATKEYKLAYYRVVLNLIYNVQNCTCSSSDKATSASLVRF